MITELSVKARHTNRKAHILSAVFIIAAALTFTARFAVDRFQGLLDLGTVALITAFVFLYTKYLSARYYYETMVTDDGEPLFIIRRMTGKRSVTLCRISFAEILSIKKETREELKKHKTPRGTVKYFYTPTLMPEKIHRIEIRSAYERAEVVIECSDEFASQLSAWAVEARAQRSAEYDI